VGQRSRAALLLLDTGAVVRIDQLTTLQILEAPQEGRSLIDLLRGIVHFFSRLPRSLEVRTPFVSAGVEGTEFVVAVESDRTLVSVFEGLVRLTNPQGSLALARNQSGIARAGQRPQLDVVARPRDAVQWTIYYQPILNSLIDPSAPATAQTLALRESMEAFSQGDLTGAFDRLDGLSEPDRNESFYVYRAGLLLAVGRVEEARSDLNRAPDSAGSYALRAVISIAQNDPDQALVNGRQAVQRSPRSSAARIALSYAQQANFELEAARDTLLQAVADQPNDTLAWARLAELWLSLGDLGRALEAAETSISVGPELGRTQTVLGFARLAQIKLSDAKASFERAIVLESESSLARLGLGLAKIRGGDLREGRRDIEIAATLDPNNSLIRSYLGKAYFEEKRDTLAEEQLDLARQLDPNDPTPYFYDAIRKQTINQPVEALHDLQRSIELNDNRAVYRSRLSLDGDLAARSASLGRIYRDLGFEQVALVEGWRSVNLDPSDYSGHRFLADTYSALPRHEVARVSELLQSQLLQPVNMTPLQPQLAESNLFILSGAGSSQVAFNEFNPLFTRNRIALQANALVGQNDTVGNDFVFSGLYERVSFSVGQFHHETDGFRENNDQNQDLYNAFLQASLGHRTSVQAEFRHSDTERGDLVLKFDRDNFDPTLRQAVKSNSVRLGLHHSLAPDSDILVSYIYKSARIDSEQFPFGPSLPIKLETEEDGYIAEVQHLFRSDRFQMISGGGHFSSLQENSSLFLFPPAQLSEIDVRHTNLYLYSLLNYPRNVIWTLGASGDFFEGFLGDRDQFNPKLGMTWDLASDPDRSRATTVRAAIFRTLKRTLQSSLTLEPTQVAGFNQFFDDTNSTQSWRWGVGIDQKFSEAVYGGVEYSGRELDVPFSSAGSVLQADYEESLIRSYLYWTLHSWVVARAEFQYERFERDPRQVGTDGFTELNTYRVPLGINFFHPLGLSAGLQGTYVNQDGKFGDPRNAPVVPADDQFWVVDLSVGYRLPQRWGLITLEIRNLFDKVFNFQDGIEGATGPPDPQISPERLIFGRFTLAF
jgi:tetratricopeptide (TPR) repeat protein/opacity protein-like surface antigen